MQRCTLESIQNLCQCAFLLRHDSMGGTKDGKNPLLVPCFLTSLRNCVCMTSGAQQHAAKLTAFVPLWQAHLLTQTGGSLGGVGLELGGGTDRQSDV